MWGVLFATKNRTKQTLAKQQVSFFIKIFKKGGNEMAYNGYLVKLSNHAGQEYTFPNEYIKAESYSAYVNMQDVDPYTDANGYLHRNPVDLKAFKCEFETVPMLTNKQFKSIMDGIKSTYTDEKGRQLWITAYVPETDSYVEQFGYLPDFTPQMYAIWDNVIRYNSVRLAFIGGCAS